MVSFVYNVSGESGSSVEAGWLICAGVASMQEPAERPAVPRVDHIKLKVTKSPMYSSPYMDSIESLI